MPRRWSDDIAADTRHEAHLWLCDLDSVPGDTRAAGSVLDDGERERMRRFVFEKDRERFLASHFFLRSVLARYVGCEPDALRFTTGEHGKPALDVVHAGAPAFNLSHSGSRALLAVVPSAQSVGVDIEFRKPGRRSAALARRNFAAPEVEYLLARPTASQDEAFYRIWTLKEAYVKARAVGLSLRLDGFCFDFGESGGLRLVARPGVDARADRWHCLSWCLEGGYSAALVHDAGRPLRPRWYQLSPLRHWLPLEVAVGFRTGG